MRKVAFGEIFEKINLGIIDSIKGTFGFEKEETEQDYSNMEGKDRLGSKNVVESLGISQIGFTLLLALLLTFTLLVTYLSSKCCTCKCCRACKKSMVSRLNWNLVINYIYVSWIKICFSVALGSRDLLTDGIVSYSTISSVTCSILFVVGLPIVFVIMLKNNYDDLNEEKTKNKMGSLYKGVKLQKSIEINDVKTTVRIRPVIYYPAVFTTRRTVFVMITVFMIEYPYQ